MRLITSATSPICSAFGYDQDCSSYLATTVVIGGALYAAHLFYQHMQRKTHGEWMNGFDPIGYPVDAFLINCKAGHLLKTRE